MYIKFSSEEDSDKYPLSTEATQRLNDELIDIISRNPSEVYGRDDTIVDKLAELVRVWKGQRSIPNPGQVEQVKKKVSKKTTSNTV